MLAYYEIMKLRERAIGDPTNNLRDAELNRFGAQADALIDDELFIVANRNKRLTKLPSLPLDSPPQSLKDAATDYAVALFLLKERQIDTKDAYEKLAKSAVKGFVLRLDSESEVYGAILD